MSNPNETYKVIFSGSILDGFSLDAVTDHFAEAFKLKDKESVQQLFCGKVITLKRGLTYEAARRYSRVLNKLGADCCLEREYNPLMGNGEIDHAYERKKRRRVHQFTHNNFDDVSLAPK